MIVADLIRFLQTQPQELPVAYQIYSEQCMLEQKEIVVCELSMPRDDGWVPHKRPDQPSQRYLLFPGN